MKIKFEDQPKAHLDSIAKESIAKISSVKTQMLITLARKHYSAYSGTVTDPEKKRRRKAGKAARKARKINYGL